MDRKHGRPLFLGKVARSGLPEEPVVELTSENTLGAYMGGK